MRRSASGFRRGAGRGVVLAVVLALGVAGCGDDDTADLSKCETVAPTDGLTEITITGKNMAFDAECFQVEPGPVEFTFVNDDDGVSHNLRVSGPGDVDEATDLERGKVTQTLEVDLSESGTYDFKCDPHPNTMKGKIVVGDVQM